GPFSSSERRLPLHQVPKSRLPQPWRLSLFLLKWLRFPELRLATTGQTHLYRLLRVLQGLLAQGWVQPPNSARSPIPRRTPSWRSVAMLDRARQFGRYTQIPPTVS